ncbi:MAG: Rha family transcriptional regulator [Flavobacteriales bacterium]
MGSLSCLDHAEIRSMVMAERGVALTSSYAVAKAFGKEHYNVLRDIDALGCSDKFRALNFEVCLKNNNLQNGKANRFYQMTKDGFMFLIMRYSGKKADTIKEAYIEAFNWMADQLSLTGFMLAKRHNEITALRDHEKRVASDSGRRLRRWQMVSKEIDAELCAIEGQLQPSLPFSSNC